ncbi:unnamed protein product, partial [Symbiodinium necroappetens]
DAAQGLHGVFPTRVLGRVSGDDTRTNSGPIPPALRHVPSKRKGGRKPAGTAPAVAASSGAKAKSNSARTLPKKARGSIRESLATPGELSKPTGSTSRRSHAPKLRAAKCKAAASSGEGRTGVGPPSLPTADNNDGPDPETQRRIMNERCAALLEAQREALRRRMEQRREAIKAATAKARAVHDPPVDEMMPTAVAEDDHAAISVDVGTHGEPTVNVQPDAAETSGYVPDSLDFLMYIPGRNLDVFALQHYVVVGVDDHWLFAGMQMVYGQIFECQRSLISTLYPGIRVDLELRSYLNFCCGLTSVSAEQVRVHNVLQGRLILMSGQASQAIQSLGYSYSIDAMRREAKRHGRLVKRERYLDQIQQAEEAAASHNAFVLYRIVRTVEPRIYAPDLTELKCSTRSIQPYKALPTTHPAAPAFKAVTEYFGDRVADWMSGVGRPCMPQSWNLTHVALIPKPGKKHGAISSLRPIGLQDPVAKGYIKVLAEVNPTKSNAIMSLRGSMSQSLRKLWTSTFRGGEWLRVPIGQDNEFIPLVQQLDYLGIVLSYGGFKELSWKRRIGVARASFERIRKILLGHHVLSLSHRIKLWRTIVLSSATYGLLGIGWSSPGFVRMHGMCMKQLRLIARSPVHLTSETNLSLMQRLGMQDLGAHFEFMTTNALAYHMQLMDDLNSEDVMCRNFNIIAACAGSGLCIQIMPISLSAACLYCGKVPTRKANTDAQSLHRLILLFWWMGDEPGIAPPTRAETSYFLSLFPRPSQMQKEQAEPMDTKDQPKRGIFEDTSSREESLSKAMKGEIHEEAASPKEPVGVRASASQPPVKVPVMGLSTPSLTTASPASTLTPQQQLLPNAATATPSGKGKTKKGKQGK